MCSVPHQHNKTAKLFAFLSTLTLTGTHGDGDSARVYKLIFSKMIDSQLDGSRCSSILPSPILRAGKVPAGSVQERDPLTKSGSENNLLPRQESQAGSSLTYLAGHKLAHILPSSSAKWS